MREKLEGVVPVVLAILLALFLYFNNSTPTESLNGYAIVQPVKEFKAIRTLSDPKEEDHHVEVSHVDRPDDILDLRMWHGYVVFPKNPDGTPAIPTRTNPDGTKTPIWKITAKQKLFGADPGWDFGTYAGYLDGPKDHSKIHSFDVGLRISPVRFFDSVALDGLVSNQAAGVGVSFYPAPERFGEFWSHVGVGYGRVITFRDEHQRNLFYFSISTDF